VFGPIVCIVYKEVVEEVLEILGTLNTEVETAVVYGVGTEICAATAFTKGFVVFHVCIVIAA
jgi:DNA-binding protein